MSANITAASTSCRRTGCSVTSAVSSADRLTSKNACRSRIARYSGSERPACRMNHTGVRSTGSRRAARTSNGSTRPRLAADGERAACRPLGRLDARRPARRARSAARGSSSRTPAPSPGATGSGSPTTGSTTAATRSSGTASAPRCRRSRRASARRSRRACARRSRPAATASRSTSWPSTAPGSRSSAARRPRPDVDVLPRARRAARRAARRGSSPPPDAAERVAAAHAEGYAVVAGAIEWHGGLGRRRPRALAPYEPGPGRIPNFAHPLLCPSVLRRARARAARGRRGPAGVRRAGRRAVALRRPDRPARAPETAGRRGLTDRSSIGTKLAQICHRHVTGWPVSSAVEGGGWPRPLSGGESAPAREKSRTARVSGARGRPLRRRPGRAPGAAPAGRRRIVPAGVLIRLLRIPKAVFTRTWEESR